MFSSYSDKDDPVFPIPRSAHCRVLCLSVIFASGTAAEGSRHSFRTGHLLLWMRVAAISADVGFDVFHRPSERPPPCATGERRLPGRDLNPGLLGTGTDYARAKTSFFEVR